MLDELGRERTSPAIWSPEPLASNAWSEHHATPVSVDRLEVKSLVVV